MLTQDQMNTIALSNIRDLISKALDPNTSYGPELTNDVDGILSDIGV